ncbi:protein slowmo [Athalia rosae]|uniref:protein slowmo n=1 Tax=Athalia rosae TaxID=37344 RepID=UPI000625A12E|nr:protein slowmo [Athalia rosae]
MKIWNVEYEFNHPWETVAKAIWRKYPNPMNPAVIGIDVIDRKIVDGVLHTHRIVSSEWGFPRWAEALIGTASVCYASEMSEVDIEKKQITLKTRNLTFCKYIGVEETVQYSPHPENPQNTLLTQEAVVTVHGVPLGNYMEDMLTSKISANAGKGRQAIEWVIGMIDAEVKDLANNAVKSTDELLAQTKKQFDDLSVKTRKSMDDLQTAAKKSFDEIHSLTTPPPQSIPKL